MSHKPLPSLVVTREGRRVSGGVRASINNVETLRRKHGICFD
jgi:hypothetical protein